jgi:hypothetical protein
MANSATFIIEPYLKASTVRSPLGFMSLATHWAQLLFPGITVLTRDFLHLELLLRELRRRNRSGESRQKILAAMSAVTLHARLEREYRHRVGDDREPGLNPASRLTVITSRARDASQFIHVVVATC